MPTPLRVEEGNTAAAITRVAVTVLRSRQNPRTLRNNMHENREISCLSWSKDQDRSAKAINRTADVHVRCRGRALLLRRTPKRRDSRSRLVVRIVGSAVDGSTQNVPARLVQPKMNVIAANRESMLPALWSPKQTEPRKLRDDSFLRTWPCHLPKNAWICCKRAIASGVNTFARKIVRASTAGPCVSLLVSENDPHCSRGTARAACPTSHIAKTF
jgi:hypothetical protein